jgi:hypothetical protein
VTFSGNLNSGVQSVSLTRTTGQIKEGFNLIGNPYPSYLDWNQITKNKFSTSMWYRTKTVANDYTFDTYNSTAQLGTSNGKKKITNLIPPMQAFWVRVDEGQTQATITVDNSKRAHTDNTENSFKTRSTENSAQSVLSLQVSNGINTDEAIIYSNPNASNGYDNYDSPKMFNNSASVAEIYTLASDENLAINGFNAIPYDVEIPLGFTTLSSGTFYLKASQINNFATGTQIILKDYQDANNPVISNLSDGSSYTFLSDATTNNRNRFALLFRAPSITTAINSNINGDSWLSTSMNGQLMITGVPNIESVITIYNSIGQFVASEKLHSNSNVHYFKLTPGVYTVSLFNAVKSSVSKVIIK